MDLTRETVKNEYFIDEFQKFVSLSRVHRKQE